jgi:hypothetical protein
MTMRTFLTGLIVAAIVAAGFAWLTSREPAELAVRESRPAAEPAAAGAVAVATAVPGPPESAAPQPATKDRNELMTLDPPQEASSGPMRLEEDLPDSPSGGAVREPDATSTVPSSSAPRLRLPETGPPPDDDRPLRGPEMPLPGLPPAADPTMLPSRPPEDQGATSTK